MSIWDSLNSYKVYNSQINKKDINQFISKIMERKSWIKLSEKAPAILFTGDSQSSDLWNDLYYKFIILIIVININ